MWVPDICLIWVMLFCLSRRRAELLNTDMMRDSESITTGEFGGNCYYGNVAENGINQCDKISNSRSLIIVHFVLILVFII